MSANECSRCRCRAGRYVIRRRVYATDATDPNNLIDLGTRPPGPDWWADVQRFWDVSDAPLPGHWTTPAKIDLAPLARGAGPAEMACGHCRAEAARSVQPSLFAED